MTIFTRKAPILRGLLRCIPSANDPVQRQVCSAADSGAYLYAGIGYPFTINDKWSLIPSLSGGYYSDGACKSLGFNVEFYSQLRLEYRILQSVGIGFGVGQISNAGIGDKNPGAETVYLTYSVSF